MIIWEEQGWHGSCNNRGVQSVLSVERENLRVKLIRELVIKILKERIDGKKENYQQSIGFGKRRDLV